MKMNESLIKYLAGLLDADGNLSFVYTRDPRRKDLFSVGLSLHLGAARVIDRDGFAESLPILTGMGSIGFPKEGYVIWRVCKRADLEMILPRLVKHMVIKARHWQWMMEMWKEIRHRGYGNQSISLQDREILEQAKKDSRKLKAGPLKPKKHPTWAWTAGYLDGDGWYIHRNPKVKRYGMSVGACAHITDVIVLEFLQNAFGGNITPHSQSENVKVWKRSLSNSDRSFALRFLPKVVKHSRLKRYKIETMIHFHQQRLSEQSLKG